LHALGLRERPWLAGDRRKGGARSSSSVFVVVVIVTAARSVVEWRLGWSAERVGVAGGGREGGAGGRADEILKE